MSEQNEGEQLVANAGVFYEATREMIRLYAESALREKPKPEVPPAWDDLPFEVRVAWTDSIHMEVLSLAGKADRVRTFIRRMRAGEN